MIKNYFKIAWRNLKKRYLYTFINILGLSTGISFALLIAIFVWQELQVNKNLKNANSQYILTSQWKDPNMGVDFATIGPIAKRLKEDYPHLVSNYYRWDGITSIIATGDKNFREGIQLGDESFLNMYGFKLLHGHAKTAFKDPFSVVVKSEKAMKFFGRKNVIGETLTIQNFEGESHEFKVTGVLVETSENTVNQLLKQSDNGFFIAKNSALYFNRANFQDWEAPIFACFIELQPGIKPSQLENPVKHLINNHAPDVIQQNLKVIPLKLSSYHLNRNNNSLEKMLLTLSFVGFFIIIMAMINFINIAISHSGSREKEIGVRKVLGGKRKQLIFQFLAESIILVTVSVALACALYPFLSDWFALITGKQLLGFSQFPTYFILIPFFFIIILSLLVGFYPAFILSSFKSIDALQGRIRTGVKATYFRKSLMSLQYIIALVVLIMALLVRKQLDSFFGKDLGYDKECLVTATVPRDWTIEGVNKMLTIRNEFSKLPLVESVSLSYEIPNGNNGFQIAVYKTGENPNQSFATQGLVSDDAYLDTYKIPLLAGTFLESRATNTNHVVINEKALYTYGFKSAYGAIGKNLNMVNSDEIYTIKGVVSDFHFESMHQHIKPQLFFNVNTYLNYRYLSFSLKPRDINKSLITIQKKWKSLMPDSTFEYEFMDATLATLYESELQFKRATYTASLLSLIITLLGIFGMVSLSIDKRLKEVGIRKVLGASITSIGFLFIKEFLSILGLSILIACPFVYLLINQWLTNYAYHISVGLSPFLIGVSLIGCITILLILFQTFKIVFANPVNSLKTE